MNYTEFKDKFLSAMQILSNQSGSAWTTVANASLVELPEKTVDNFIQGLFNAHLGNYNKVSAFKGYCINWNAPYLNNQTRLLMLAFKNFEFDDWGKLARLVE